jgi:hypothetical protein
LDDLWVWLLNQALKNGVIKKSTHAKLYQAWVGMNKAAVARKERLVKKGMTLLDGKWFDLFRSLIKSLKSVPNLVLLAHLTNLNLNENTMENIRMIAEEIVRFMNAPELVQEMQEYHFRLTRILFETRADYLMCKLLNLRWDHYASMIESYKNRIAHRSNPEGLNELEFRKAILRKTALYKDKKVRIDQDIDNLARGMSLYDIAAYLDDLSIREDDFPTKVINGKSLQYLREYYHHKTQKKGGNLEEINLIERLWNLGVELFEV